MAKPKNQEELFSKAKEVRVEDLMSKYKITADSIWNIRQYGFGQMVQCFENLCFEDCKALFLNLDKNHDLSTRVFVDGKKILIYEAWELFRSRRSDWVAYL